MLEQIVESGNGLPETPANCPEFKLLKRPKPVGYAAQAPVFLGDMIVGALLDSGATCSAVPEECMVAIYNYAQSWWDRMVIELGGPGATYDTLSKENQGWLYMSTARCGKFIATRSLRRFKDLVRTLQ